MLVSFCVDKMSVVTGVESATNSALLNAPPVATSAALVDSEDVGDQAKQVAGADWALCGPPTLQRLAESFLTSGIDLSILCTPSCGNQQILFRLSFV